MSGYVALFASFLLAGTGMAESAASAAEPNGAVRQAAGKHAVFSCQLSGGKTATVTQDGGRFLYRYGTAGRPELTIEGTAKNGRIFQKAAYHGGVTVNELRFVSGAYSYIVHSFPRSDIVDNEPNSGLKVFRGGKMIMDRSCSPWAAISFRDFEHPSELPDNPEGAPSVWGE